MQLLSVSSSQSPHLAAPGCHLDAMLMCQQQRLGGQGVNIGDHGYLRLLAIAPSQHGGHVTFQAMMAAILMHCWCVSSRD